MIQTQTEPTTTIFEIVNDVATMTVITTAAAFNGYKCIECEQLWDGDQVQECGPVYECSCGTQYSKTNSADGGDSHRCPDCNKFGSRVDKHDDLSCPECAGGVVVQADVIVCPICNDHIEGTADAWAEHMTEDCG